METQPMDTKIAETYTSSLVLQTILDPAYIRQILRKLLLYYFF